MRNPLITLVIIMAFGTTAAGNVMMAEETDTVITHDPAEYITGTLPVMHIYTDSLKPIVSKEDYIMARYWLDGQGHDEWPTVGSPDEMLPMQIRGRGNFTWGLEKKPYRIKLDEKAKLLGMHKSKHFALMAHYDDSGMLINDELGFEFSRRLNMAFTPEHHPVELVLNGNYEGIYFLTETIRVDKNRVNITEMDDYEQDPELFTGGWLVEIDNIQESGTFYFKHGRVKWHSPERITGPQYWYIYNLFGEMDTRLFGSDKTDNSWEELVDVDTLARFYIINEIMDDREAFAGSCYMHKERGDSTKLIFGPVWDFGRSLERRNESECNFLYENAPSYINNDVIKEMLKYPHFQRIIREVWTAEVENIKQGLDTKVQDWAELVKAACAANQKRWPNGHSYSIDYYKKKNTDYLYKRIAWLDDQWNLNKLCDINGDGEVNIIDANILIGIILGSEPEGRIKYTDVNFDGSTDVVDVNIIIGTILGNN